MLENLKLLLGLGQNDEPLLNVLIKMCKNFAMNYCNLDSYETELDYIVQQMVCEKYSQLGSQGLSSRSFSGVSEDYFSNYSDSVMTALRRHRHIGVIQ